MKDESNCFDVGNLTTAKPAVSGDLLLELAPPEISDNLTLKKPIISDDLAQDYIELLMPSEQKITQQRCKNHV